MAARPKDASGKRAGGSAKRSRSPRRSWDRRPDPARRAELLERFLDYALEHGLAKASVRAAGRELGTSGRMLIHYFGSREKLIVEALGVLRRRNRDRVFRSVASRPATFDEAYWRQWRFLTSAETLRSFRLSYEALGLALQSPEAYREFLDSLTLDFRTSFEASLPARGLSPARRRAIATAYLAALRGLVIDLLVTGDRHRIRAAAALVAENLKRELAPYS
jgi:AcrR family transcriptional regulator